MDKNLESDVKFMTDEEIVSFLKSLVVGENDVLPMKTFSFVVPNPEYDPDGFSQEIEDSEEEVDTIACIKEWSDSDSDFVKKLLFGNLEIQKNSDEWLRNHSKICKTKFLNAKVWAQCVNHINGVRDYFGEKVLNDILRVKEEYGGIVRIC